MPMWSQTYPNLDTHLHELATTLTSSPMITDVSVTSVADATKAHFGADIPGSNANFDEWAKPDSNDPMGWTQTYFGLDAYLHEMALVLTASPMMQDTAVTDVAEAVKSYFSVRIPGSSADFSGWGPPPAKDTKPTAKPTTGVK